MKKNIKRILATIMTVVMILTAIPFAGINFNSIFAGKASAKTIEEYTSGDIIEFGSYPQSNVTDETILSGIKSVEDDYEWISYNYYSGSGEYADGKMKPDEDMMWYKDIAYNGNKYRAVWIKKYRPECTGSTSTKSTFLHQQKNGYYTGNVYYFEYEPLEWRVLNPIERIVMCNKIIDSQAYNNYIIEYGINHFCDSSKTYYASDWENSSIRKWLNIDFYNTAFTSSEKAQISTSYIESKSEYSALYDSRDTRDKIFLLSCEEATATSYGLHYDESRRLDKTEYAKCQGLFMGNCSWLLRTPYKSFGASTVFYTGSIKHAVSAGDTYNGIVPAFKFNPKSTICPAHSYESAVTVQPTCTTDGVRTYTCSNCGDTYTEAIDKLGHNFGAYTVTTSATCTAKGVETRNCSRCTATETQEVAAKGHKYTATVTNPTCTASGFTTYKCSECTDSYVSDYKSATGHNFSAVTTRPTCTQSGYTTYTCTCGESYTSNYISATGHNYKTIVTAPTCTQSGYTTHKCQSCESSYVDSYVSAKGHTDGDWKVTRPATETVEGIKTLYCADCHIALRTESVPKLDPQPEKGKVKSVDIKDVTIEYKESAVIKPTIVADNGVKYDVDFKSSDTKFVTVDKNGKIYGAKKGSAKVTCTVTDEFGNVVKDTCTVTVKYSALQWFIEIALFGWIWY